MAQRNPMNQRYQGEGPGGQTRKSATSAKPVSKAAASVHIKKKPTTKSEKRAAEKAREREAEAKAKQKAEREAEKAKAAGVEEEDKTKGKSKGGFFDSFKGAANRGMPQSEEYKKWQRVYWILIVIAIITILISFFITNTEGYNATLLTIQLVVAYGAMIAAFFIQIRKIRPLLKKQSEGDTGKKTPKALKHEQEAREQAAAVEAARKAARESKKASRRRERTVVSDDDEE